MTTENCIIVGASHAGVSLALQLRKEGWAGGIQLLSDEPELPYHRPPLSKDLIAGSKTAESIRLRPEKIYTDNSIQLMLDTEVQALDREARCIILRSGQALAYDKLALCTGATVRRLALAGQRANVLYIRTLADVARLQALMGAGRRVVIIGAGYIGLEAAAQLVQQQHAVTVLEAADRVLQRVTAPEVSRYYAALHAAHGVAIHTNVTITAITGEDRVDTVRCEDGREFPVDLLIVGIGIEPATALAAQAGLQVDSGIVVDAFARTSDPCIYAAGDCTRHPSSLYERPLRLESVQNATDQARIAAANICGKQTVYDSVPWFWSDQYGTKLQTAGIHSGYDTLVQRGALEHPAATGFSVLYLREGRLIAADCLNRPQEFMASKQLIGKRATIASDLLQNEAQDLGSLLKQL